MQVLLSLSDKRRSSYMESEGVAYSNLVPAMLLNRFRYEEMKIVGETLSEEEVNDIKALFRKNM